MNEEMGRNALRAMCDVKNGKMEKGKKERRNDMDGVKDGGCEWEAGKMGKRKKKEEKFER